MKLVLNILEEHILMEKKLHGVTDLVHYVVFFTTICLDKSFIKCGFKYLE